MDYSHSAFDVRSITIDPSTGFASSSLDPLPVVIKNGMIAMGLIGILSTASTLGLLLFITYRMVYWRRYYDAPIHTNQVFILIYNLLLADFQQALSFLFAWHWIKEGKLIGPSTACFAQAWLIQIGDVSSGLWVLAIAVHTFINLIIRRQISLGIFIWGVVAIWAFCLFLTVIGPALRDGNFFIPAGAWCWMSEERESERLYLHYLWIFLAQLGSLVIYVTIFFVLRTNLSASALPGGPSSSTRDTHPSHMMSNAAVTTTVITTHQPQQTFVNSRKRILRTAKYMVLYPIVYVLLTLPLAAGRVSAMAGRSPPPVFFCIAGSLMASCGYIDVILYITTRKALVRSSVGIKGTTKIRNNRKIPRSNSKSRFWNRETKGDDQIDGPGVRMDEFYPGEHRESTANKENIRKGAIVVSKTVTRREDSEDAFEVDISNAGDTTPGRSDSLRSLVGTGR